MKTKKFSGSGFRTLSDRDFPHLFAIHYLFSQEWHFAALIRLRRRGYLMAGMAWSWLDNLSRVLADEGIAHVVYFEPTEFSSWDENSRKVVKVVLL